MTAAIQEISSLPSWVPEPGYLKSIHTNDLSDFNPAPNNDQWYSEASKQNGPWTNWCGAVFASDYSELGAMVFWGGGHGGYDGTEFYIFDLTTRTWSRLNDPVPYDFLPDTSADWCDVKIGDNFIAPASHTYSGAVYWPAAAGGGPKGSWVLPYNVYGGGPGSGAGTVGYRGHAVDLSTGKWTRLTVDTLQPYYPTAANGGCFVDKHNILWGLQGSSTENHVKIDLASPNRSVAPFKGFYTPGYYWNPVYLADRDFAVSAYCNYTGKTAGVILYDLNSASPMDTEIHAENAPDMPNGSGFGFDYCPDTDKFYAYNGFGDQVVHVLTPPEGDWKTGKWVWSTEPMLGELAANINEITRGSQGGQAFTKWKYNPKLKCFMWSQGTVARASPDGVMRKGTFQLYRPQDSTAALPSEPPPVEVPPVIVTPVPENPTQPSEPPVDNNGAFVAFGLISHIAHPSAPFMIGHDFVEGDVPSGTYVRTDLYNSAVVEDCHWNDGSLKHATIMGRVSLVADQEKQVNIFKTLSPPSGKILTIEDLRAAKPSASISIGGVGSVSLESLIGNAPDRVYISCSEAVECHWSSSVGLDKNLYTEFYVRLCATGDIRVDVIRGNGFLGNSPEAVNYVPKITVGGKTIYDNGGATFTHSPWTKFNETGWIGTDPQIIPRHDTGYLGKTKLSLNYGVEGVPQSALDYLNSINNFTPQSRLGFTEDMGATGYQDQIGLLPRWDALYHTTQGHPAAYKAVVAHGRAAFGYPIAYADSETRGPISLDKYASWSLYGDRQGGSYGQQSVTGHVEYAHHPSMGFLAYRLTSDYFFLTVCQFTAKWVYLCNDINTGNGVKRYLRGQNRACAWGTRSISQAAAIVPTRIKEMQDIKTLFGNMAIQRDIQYSGNTGFVLGLEDLYNNRIDYRGSLSASEEVCASTGGWEHDFNTSAWGHAVDMEPCDNTAMESAKRFVSYLYNWQVTRLGGNGLEDHNFGYAANYTQTFRLDVKTESTYEPVSHTRFRAISGGQMFSDTFSTSKTDIKVNPATNVLTGESGASPALASGYWANLTPAISFAVDHKKEGAQDSWTRLTNADNYSTTQAVAGYNEMPQFYVVPRNHFQPTRVFKVGSSSNPPVIPPVDVPPITPPIETPPVVTPVDPPTVPPSPVYPRANFTVTLPPSKPGAAEVGYKIVLDDGTVLEQVLPVADYKVRLRVIVEKI